MVGHWVMMSVQQAVWVHFVLKIYPIILLVSRNQPASLSYSQIITAEHCPVQVSSQPQSTEKLHCSSWGFNNCSSCWWPGENSIFMSRGQDLNRACFDPRFDSENCIMCWIHWAASAMITLGRCDPETTHQCLFVFMNHRCRTYAIPIHQNRVLYTSPVVVNTKRKIWFATIPFLTVVWNTPNYFRHIFLNTQYVFSAVRGLKMCHENKRGEVGWDHGSCCHC